MDIRLYDLNNNEINSTNKDIITATSQSGQTIEIVDELNIKKSDSTSFDYTTDLIIRPLHNYKNIEITYKLIEENDSEYNKQKEITINEGENNVSISRKAKVSILENAQVLEGLEHELIVKL